MGRFRQAMTPRPPVPARASYSFPLQTQLHFPVDIDMAPYTTPAILRSRSVHCTAGGMQIRLLQARRYLAHARIQRGACTLPIGATPAAGCLCLQ